MHTGVLKIPTIVRLYQIQTTLREKMLGIDTILGTVCIVEKSIYSGAWQMSAEGRHFLCSEMQVESEGIV